MNIDVNKKILAKSLLPNIQVCMKGTTSLFIGSQHLGLADVSVRCVHGGGVYFSGPPIFRFFDQ